MYSNIFSALGTMKDQKAIDHYRDALEALQRAMSDGSPGNSLWQSYQVLSNDCMEALKGAISNNNAFHRRSLARNLFALIEGTVYAWKQVIYFIAKDFHIALEPGEESILTEEVSALNSDGVVKQERLRLPTKVNIKYTLKRAGEIFLATIPVDFGDSGWRTLQAAIVVRDRMMHPKKPEDLEVSNTEIMVCIDALMWFGESTRRLLVAYSDFLRTRRSSIFTPTDQIHGKEQSLPTSLRDDLGAT